MFMCVQQGSRDEAYSGCDHTACIWPQGSVSVASSAGIKSFLRDRQTLVDEYRQERKADA